jgi:Fe-Mn family superoxide dismutase
LLPETSAASPQRTHIHRKREEDSMTSLTRRHLFGTIAGAAAVTRAPRIVVAQTSPPPAAGPFSVEPLAYPFNALEPYIDAKTMQIHHDLHHGAYVNNLNTIAKDHPQIAQMPIQDVLAKLSELPESIRTPVRNNLGGHANHTMFWQIMGPGGGTPSGDVAAAIDRDLGGWEKFQTDFNAAGLRVFGSGWVVVTAGRDGKLALETRPNQDSVLMDGKRVLVGNDVWEHAYYLTYQNRRADYLKAWWNVVSWTKIAERYAAAKAGTLAV